MSFAQKSKNVFTFFFYLFTFPETSVDAKNQKILMRRFLEKCHHGDRERKKERDRDETEFIGPIPPVGVGPKIMKI